MSESPESVESFGLAEDDECSQEESRVRFARLSRENAKMRRILDRVQELVEEGWSRGERARVIVEFAHRRGKPLSDDAVSEEPPLEWGDGMEGNGSWVRIKNWINMDTC